MKRCIGMILFSLCLSGCSCTVGGSGTLENSAVPESSIKEAKDVVGEQTAFGTPIVSLKLNEGKIVELNIDEIIEDGTKKELKDEYVMSESAVAPWWKQIETLEKYILDHGLESLELKDGKAVNEDLISSVTINIENYVKTINKALNEAK